MSSTQDFYNEGFIRRHYKACLSSDGFVIPAPGNPPSGFIDGLRYQTRVLALLPVGEAALVRLCLARGLELRKASYLVTMDEKYVASLLETPDAGNALYFVARAKDLMACERYPFYVDLCWLLGVENTYTPETGLSHMRALQKLMQ